MVTPLILFVPAMTLIFVGIYRSTKDTSVSTRLIFGWNLGLIWALSFIGGGVALWGTDGLLGLIIGAVVITALFVAGAIFIGRPPPTSKHAVLDKPAP